MTQVSLGSGGLLAQVQLYYGVFRPSHPMFCQRCPFGIWRCKHYWISLDRSASSSLARAVQCVPGGRLA